VMVMAAMIDRRAFMPAVLGTAGPGS
jgi:hypothetical protein